MLTFSPLKSVLYEKSECRNFQCGPIGIILVVWGCTFALLIHSLWLCIRYGTKGVDKQLCMLYIIQAKAMMSA